MTVKADFPVKSLCSALNFRPEQRKDLGWANYCVCFIDAAMLIHFLSAILAFLEATHISKDSSRGELRFALTISLASLYTAVFLVFFATYCCVKDGFDLIRYRLGVLLSSGIANMLFLAIISCLIISYKGKDHYLNELEVDFAEESDIAWLSVLVLSGATVFMSLLAGVISIKAFQKIEKMANASKTYFAFSPESPFTSYWKQNVMSGADFVRSPSRNSYQHRSLITLDEKKKEAFPGHQALLQELKTNLPKQNEEPKPKRTAL